MNEPAPLPGTHLLLLACDRQTELSIGRLGKMNTRHGYYLYVGSAFGPGGVQARIRHHERITARPRWHLDYLRTVTGFVDAWCVYQRRCEHQWAQKLLQDKRTAMPLKNFGSSDCNCVTHLFYLKHKPAKAVMEGLLNCKLETV
jgi:Uri superfamily endonuclease